MLQSVWTGTIQDCSQWPFLLLSYY